MSDIGIDLPVGEEEEETPPETFDFSAILLKLKQGFTAKRLSPAWGPFTVRANIPEPGSTELKYLFYTDYGWPTYTPNQEDLFATDWVLTA
jgi:hypothetical protein